MKFTPKVHTHFAGSICVVELTPGALEPGSNGTYIDSQIRQSANLIEVVQAGHVTQRFFEVGEAAPARIVSIMREHSHV